MAGPDPNQPFEISAVDLPSLAQSDPARYQIYQSFMTSYGRPPSPNEVAQYRPAIQSLGADQMSALVAQQATADQNTPAALAKKQQDATNAALPQYTGQVNDLFKQVLGRDATADETDHFGKLMASGSADAYTLGQALQQLPEYQNAQNAKNRDAVSGELQKADTDYFNQNLMPAIQSNFAQQGRVVGPESQTLANALVSAGNQQNVSREQYLAQLGASDYANTRQNTVNNYLNSTQRAQQLQDQSTARSYQLTDQSQANLQGISNYAAQQSAYQDYLNRMGRRQSSGLGAGIGSLVGAGLGLALSKGNASAGMLGAGLGKTGGGLFDSY